MCNTPKKHQMKFTLKLTTITLGLLLTISCNIKRTASEMNTILSESKFLTDSVYSEYLKEYRKHTIYLPKGFDKNKKYPIVYATDGGSGLTDVKLVLDSLIVSNNIKPLLFVASFANNKIADSTSVTNGLGEKIMMQFRNFEYVNNMTEDTLLMKRFPNHMSYFIKEFIPGIEKQYNQNLNKSDRYFYGVSNGAGFGLSLLNNRPDLIGTYICFSTFGGDIQSNNWDINTKYPNLYLKYGTEEPFFLKDDAEFLKSKYGELNSFIEIKEYEGGHNNKYWSKEFIEVMNKVIKVK